MCIRDRYHGDVLIADFDHERSALFVAVVIGGGKAVIAAGRGAPFEVREFVDRELPEDPISLIPEMERRFTVIGERLEFTDSDIYGWVSVDVPPKTGNS